MPKPDLPEADERQRAVRALDLRTSGMTYAALAAELGYSDESGPRKAVDRLLSRVEHEGVSEMRQLEGQRLDAMQRAIWPQASGGDIDAIKAALNIMGRRAKLFGLDAPQRMQVGSEVSDVEFAESMAELISILRPETLRDMFKTMPGGAALLAADARERELALHQPVSPHLEAHSGEMDDDWSNIGVPVSSSPLPEQKPEPESEPGPAHVRYPPRRPTPAATSDLSMQLRRRVGERRWS